MCLRNVIVEIMYQNVSEQKAKKAKMKLTTEDEGQRAYQANMRSKQKKLMFSYFKAIKSCLLLLLL